MGVPSDHGQHSELLGLSRLFPPPGKAEEVRMLSQRVQLRHLDIYPITVSVTNYSLIVNMTAQRIVCAGRLALGPMLVPRLPKQIAAFATRGRTLCSSSDCGISRFPIPKRNSLDEDIREKWDKVEEQGGFIPNVFKVLANHPDEFRAFFHYHDAIMETETGSLTKADKEMIVVATSAENNCLYCVVAHSALHRLYSKNPNLADQIATNWRDADLGEREKAILEFAIDVCHCRQIEESHFEKLEQHGLSREDAWNIGAITAFFGLSNRMAGITKMKPNKEFYLLGRVNKELYTKAMKK